ncbi:peptidoglycan-binding domain-containing protein [Dongia sp.]|uniref:peptidoglycan-binding domain-containing protein n=1 Tax=Dongia sp. TaxID=1977262 RepID=UPI0035B0A579
MSKKGKYLIGSLVTAGLLPFGVQADGGGSDVPKEEKNSFFDDALKLIQNIDESHEFILVGHSSHSSHASHQSHWSHRSYFRPPDMEPGDATAFLQLDERNMRSTPPTSVLPSSPALTKKLKVLPGNSAKFQDIVTRVQLALMSKGFHPGDITGQVDAVTVAALFKYQSANGEIPSGKVTNQTLSSLGIVAQ